jgi:hypothetical protein
MAGKIPSLFELFQLTEQLELDKDLPVALARERDHAIAARCSSKDDAGRLLFWLQEVSAQRPGEDAPQEYWGGSWPCFSVFRAWQLFSSPAGGDW